MPQAVIPDPSSGPDGPDLEGFREAQERLRQNLGQEITFLVSSEKVWPEGTAIDPESGEPFDPTIDPETGGDITEVVITCIVVSRLIRGEPNEAGIEGPQGVARGESAALIVGTADLVEIEGATDFILNDITYGIQEITSDGLTGVDRYICFGEAR